MLRHNNGLLVMMALLVVTIAPVLAVACSVLGPSPEIVGRNLRDGFSGFDYKMWVDCTVRNNGNAGDIEVTAELNAGGQWKRRQVVNVASGEERLVAIEFADADPPLFSQSTYSCSASAS